MPLRPSYADRVFTTSVVSYPGIVHIGESRDFSPVIAKALELGGYEKDTLVPGMNGGSTVATGFARDAVLHHAGEIVEAVKAGKIRHFFLVGGCDGTRPSRRYYTEFAKLTPPDTVLLTLACGKFRLNDLPLGTVPGTGLPPHPGRGPVQRRLQRHPDRAGAGGRLWLLGQRTAPLHHPVLV